LILERKNECELLEILHRIMNSEEYLLNSKYLKKFSLKSKLAVRAMIIGLNLILFLAFMIAIVFATTAYFDPEMDFSIIIIMIWFLIIIISLYYAFSVLFIANVYTYIVSLYMKYRFRQIQDFIEIYLERGNIL